jgi:colanic acid biosynthesis glycosyl transferase WcaI
MMIERCASKGVTESKTFLFPNWSNPDQFQDATKEDRIMDELGVGDGQVAVLFAGNMGAKHGLEVILGVAEQTRHNSRLRYLLVGDGAARPALELLAKAGDLTNVTFLPSQPPDRFARLLTACDIHLAPQRADAADLVLPSKVTNILAAGGPLIVTAKADTELGSLVDNNSFGVRVEPGSVTQLRQAIESLAADKAGRIEMGKAARRYAERHLSKDNILTVFEAKLAGVVGGLSD